MNVFNFYSEYYNLLYKDKNYDAEAEYIAGLISQFKPNAKTILDLGCGTGKHAYHLSEKGFKVTGVDISAAMLEMTKELPDNNIEFIQADIRELDLQRKYDAVISLFHVLSYQQTNNDVSQMFATVSRHLNKGAIFICDCWYGPGVMNDKPSVRYRTLESGRVKIIRIANPETHYDKNIVNVNYELFAYDKQNGELREIKETHGMRYFFDNELYLFAAQNGLEIVSIYEWMTPRKADQNTWNICFCGKKI